MKKLIIITSLILLVIGYWTVITIPRAEAEYQLQIKYPEIDIGEGPSGPSGGLVGYLHYIYILGLSAVGIAALGSLVYGGLTYMLSDTITSKDNAKEIIWGAISGLILALAAYLILYTINPDLTSFKFSIPCTPGNCPAECKTSCPTTGEYFDLTACQCVSDSSYSN